MATEPKTFRQNLMFHPHLHCVVPGGGLSADGQRWVRCRAGFFLSVRVLSRLFRRLFLERVEKAFNSGKLQFFASLEFLRDPHAFAARIDSAKDRQQYQELTGRSLTLCPRCLKGQMAIVESLPPALCRAPVPLDSS
jgi:hypothetical protein